MTRRSNEFQLGRDIRRTALTDLATSELLQQPLTLDWSFPDEWDDEHGWTAYTVTTCQHKGHRRLPVVVGTKPDRHGELERISCLKLLHPTSFTPAGPLWPVSADIIRSVQGPYSAAYQLAIMPENIGWSLVLTTFGFGLVQQTSEPLPWWQLPVAYMQLGALPPLAVASQAGGYDGVQGSQRQRLYGALRLALMIHERTIYTQRMQLTSPYEPRELQRLHQLAEQRQAGRRE